MFGLMNLRVFWDSVRGDPLLDTAFPVLRDQRLTDLIREEVLRRDPAIDSVDFVRDIKSAKTLSGKDVLRCLELPVSAFFAMSANDEPKTLGRDRQTHTRFLHFQCKRDQIQWMEQDDWQDEAILLQF